MLSNTRCVKSRFLTLLIIKIRRYFCRWKDTSCSVSDSNCWGCAVLGAGKQLGQSQLWEPHLQLFCLRLMEKSPTRRTPRKLHVLNSSVSKSTPRNNERWDSQGVEHCAEIFGLLGNRRSDNLLRRALLAGKDPSHYNIICVFPGFPLVQFTHPAGKFLSHLTEEKE